MVTLEVAYLRVVKREEIRKQKTLISRNTQEIRLFPLDLLFRVSRGFVAILARGGVGLSLPLSFSAFPFSFWSWESDLTRVGANLPGLPTVGRLHPARTPYLHHRRRLPPAHCP